MALFAASFDLAIQIEFFGRGLHAATLVPCDLWRVVSFRANSVALNANRCESFITGASAQDRAAPWEILIQPCSELRLLMRRYAKRGGLRIITYYGVLGNYLGFALADGMHAVRVHNSLLCRIRSRSSQAADQQPLSVRSVRSWSARPGR